MMSVQRLRQINIWGAAIVLFAPLLANANFIYPYIFLKNAFFRAAILLLIISLTWYIFSTGKIIWRRHYILWAFLLFVGTQIVAAIFGVDFYQSLLGNFERMDGIITTMLLGVYLFLVVSTFRTKDDWVFLLRSTLLCSVCISLYAIMRLGNISLSFLLAKNASTIGNTAFLGSYVLFHIFIAALLWYWDKNKTWRNAYLAIGAINILVLFLNASRGSILGLVFGCFVGMVMYFPRASTKIKASFVGAIVITMLFSGLVLWQKDSAWVSQVKFLKRLTDISTQDYSTNNRLLIWGASLKAIKEKPITGYGPENMYYGLNKYYEPRITEEWFDRSHNFIFDYLGSSGVVGLIGYVSIFITLFVMVYKKRERNFGVAVVVISFFAAYLFANLFVFDTINTWVVIVTMTGFASFFSRATDDEITFSKSIDALYYPALGLVCCVAVVAGYFFVIKPYQSNRDGAEALKYYSSDGEKVLEYYRRAFSYNTIGSKEFSLQFAQYAAAAINEETFDYQLKKQIFEESEKRLLTELKNNPHDIRVRLMLAQLYHAYAQYNSFYLDESVRIVESNISDSPRRPAVYSSIAQSYFLKNDFEKSFEYLKKVVDLGSARESDYINIINISAKLKDAGKVDTYAQEFFHAYPTTSPDNYRTVAQNYFAVGSADKAETVLTSMLLPRYPDYMPGYVTLASLYDYKQDYRTAYSVLQNAMKLHPEWKKDIEAYSDAIKNKIK